MGVDYAHRIILAPPLGFSYLLTALDYSLAACTYKFTPEHLHWFFDWNFSFFVGLSKLLHCKHSHSSNLKEHMNNALGKYIQAGLGTQLRHTVSSIHNMIGEHACHHYPWKITQCLVSFKVISHPTSPPVFKKGGNVSSRKCYSFGSTLKVRFCCKILLCCMFDLQHTW